jgi:hypothetical protein
MARIGVLLAVALCIGCGGGGLELGDFCNGDEACAAGGVCVRLGAHELATCRVGCTERCPSGEACGSSDTAAPACLPIDEGSWCCAVTAGEVWICGACALSP